MLIMFSFFMVVHVLIIFAKTEIYKLFSAYLFVEMRMLLHRY